MDANAKIDPWWNAHFFSPLMRLQGKAESLGLGPQKRHERLWEVRRFAGRLSECCDDADMTGLVETDNNGAARFSTFAAEVAIGLAAKNPAANTVLSPKAGKPFAALAGFVLFVLDRLELQNRGMTTEQRPGS